MTLAELLIVLAILAITSVVALQAVTPLMDQARVDATIKTLNNVAGAIVSTNETAVSGFVADTGRLPVNGIADLTGLYSSGTLVQPVDLPASSLVGVESVNWNSSSSIWNVATNVPPTATGTYLCTLASGWRGPYLTPPAAGNSIVIGTSESVPNITDGWGYSLSADPSGMGVFAISATTYNITLSSPGSTSGPSGGISTVVSSSQFMASSISGNIYHASGGAPPYVMLLGAGPLAQNSVSVVCIATASTGLSSPNPVATFNILPTSVDAGSGAAVGVQPLLVGPKVLMPVTSTSPASGTAVTTGTAMNFVVQPGAMTVNLYF